METPCLTIREETEWTETVDAGANFLCPPLAIEIRAMAQKVLDKPPSSKVFSHDIFGDGLAAKKIVEEVNQYYETSFIN